MDTGAELRDDSPLDGVMLQCPKCDAVVRIDPTWYGRQVCCPHCQNRMVITAFRGSGGDASEQAAPMAQLVDESDPDTDVEPSGEHGDTLSADRPDNNVAPTIAPSTGQDAAIRQRVLGRYQLTKLLGKGGFGEVYLAIDPELDRSVAIKLPRLAGNRDAAKRFRKEARSVAKLRHPNIVAVFDHGQTDQHVYIVYEYVPGRTLEQHFAEKTVTQHQLLQWIIVLADAMAYAASEDIVHRDIKPANVMIDTRNRPQVMDFGLAEALAEGKASTGGRIAGTPAYMSPEQARGDRELSPASDQYSLGAILYEGLCGQKTVQGSGTAAILQIVQRDGPPTQPLERLPKDLRSICLRALANAPQDRYESCSELAEDVRRYLSKQPIKAVRVGPIRRASLWYQRNAATAIATGVSASLIVLVALISFIAAVRLAAQSRELTVALLQTRIAKTQAEENLQEAQRQRGLAEQQTAAAEQSRLLADRARKDAEDALAREQDARRVAQQAIDDAETASEAKRAAVADSEMARSELLSATEMNRALQYTESLVKANNLIRRGEKTEARSVLNGCDSDQCGWEWRWLMTQTKSQSRAASKLNKVPPAMIAALTLPAPYMTYDATQESKAEIDVPDPPFLSLSPDRSTGVVVRMDSAARSAGVRYQAGLKAATVLIPSINSVVKLNLARNSVSDVAGGLFNTTHARMLDDNGLAMILSSLPKENLDGQPTYEFVMQIWDTRSPSRMLLQEPLSNRFLPSVVYFRQRKLLLGCIHPDELVSWRLDQGERLASVQLDFSVKNGPDASRLLPSGEIAFIDRLGRIHYADPVTSSFRTAMVPDEQLIKGSQLIWSSDHRYLLSKLIKPTSELSVNSSESLAAPAGLQVGPSSMSTEQQIALMKQHAWQLHDVVSGVRLAELPAPATEITSLAVRNEQYNRMLLAKDPKSTPVSADAQRARLCRRLLRVDQIHINEADNQVAYRDASGGVVCFSLESDGGVISQDVSLGFEARLTAAATNRVAFSDGRKIALAVLDDPQKADVKQLRRNRASMIRSIAISEDGSLVLALDDQGSINIWSVETRRIVKEFDDPNLVVAAFLNRKGTRLGTGTVQGDVIIRDLEQDRIVATIRSHAGAVIAMKALPSRAAFVTTGEDSTIQFLDSLTGDRLHPQVFYGSEIATRLIATPNENVVLAMGGQSAVRFSFADRVIRKLDEFALPHTVRCGAFHPRADRLLISDSRTVSVLETVTGRRLFSFPAHAESISLLRFENDDTLCFLDSTGKLFRRIADEKR